MSEISKNEKRVLVISGGGSRGAWGGGLIKALCEREQPDYRCIVGNSTGSLLAPLVAINAFEEMEKGFTDVAQDDIFNVNPFNGNGKIDMIQAIGRILAGKENLGETENLKRRIADFFTIHHYDKLKASGKIVKAAVVSLTSNKVVFRSTDEYSYEEMQDWIWASANQPIFMSTYEKDNEKWVDGGLKENVPIAEGLKYGQEHGIRYVDVVVNNREGVKEERWPEDGASTNVVPKLLRVIDIFSDEVRLSDIMVGILEACVNDMEITLYYMNKEDYDLSPQSLLFKKEILKELWKRGYEHKFVKQFNDIILPGNNRLIIK